MTAIPFAKMHGTRNDFIVIDTRERSIPNLALFARRYCDRHSGIGADGVLAIEASPVADARMRVINADGSEAEMCGNGIRCVARFLAEAGAPERLAIETLAGIRETAIESREGDWSVRVAMGATSIERGTIAFPDATVVRVGNPHVVLFVDALDTYNLAMLAGRITDEPAFADGANVHLTVLESDRVRVRHFERGVGETQACGTGAVAVAAATRMRDLLSTPMRVEVPGGTLVVDFDARGEASLLGPAVRVFDGVLYDDVA
uniref:diaminopimelate epimerase n=1 Tax=mine drainage metagenome TaxID=410659 RepID=E6PFG8_9ZZZZ